jgi:hypothetical protein
MNTQEISDKLAAITKRLTDAKLDGFTTLTFWDKRMKLRGGGNYSVYLRTNIYGGNGREAAELNVGGEDLTVMFEQLDAAVTKHLDSETLLAKTLGIEVAA